MKENLFKTVVEKYEAVFLDSYGVLKNYKGLIKGAIEAIDYIQSQGMEFFILTNDASGSPLQLAERFQKLGLKDIEPSKIISSGMMAQEYLRHKLSGGKVACLGTEDAAHYIEKAGLEVISISKVSLEDIEEISAVVFLDDEGFDWNTDINKTINLIRKKNIPTIVANSDLTYPISKNEVAVATGGISDLIERIVKKRFIHFGKPDSQMFMFAFERLQQTRKISKKQILMVGDTLHTDIMGGNKFGIDTALVLSGNTRPERAQLRIRSSGIIPNYVCESIAI